MKYLKTYEGLFDFLKKKYKQTTNILDELAFGEDSEDSEESEGFTIVYILTSFWIKYYILKILVKNT
jgi:hypothetical protein